MQKLFQLCILRGDGILHKLLSIDIFFNNLHEHKKVCDSAALLPVSSFLPEGAPSDNSRKKMWTPGKPNAGVNACGDWLHSCRKVF